MGFNRRIGAYPSTVAEILAIRTGLEVCLRLNLKVVRVYSDLLEAINALWRDCSLQHPYREEIEATRRLIHEFEKVQISHRYR